MTRIAFYGKPGAGKSTFTRMLADVIRAKGLPVVTPKIGAPLYELQALIYQVAGASMVTPDKQDGGLLNSLAHHLRRINPSSLTDTFALRVEEAVREQPDVVFLCDDMRAPDVDALAQLGFTMVQIWAPDDLRRFRKAGRGDLAPGDENHETEADVQCSPKHRIENTGSLEMLRARALELAEELLG